MNIEDQADEFAKLMLDPGSLLPGMHAPAIDLEQLTSEERIKYFNRQVDEASLLNRGHATTQDFQKKIMPSAAPVDSLRPISIADLEVGKTHRGRVLFGKIVSKVLVMNAKTVLLEDESGGLVELAIYGDIAIKQLRKDRPVAVKEPFYKLRADRTNGIRVDNPKDLKFDFQATGTSVTTRNDAGVERQSARERARDLLKDDMSIGVSRLHKVLLEEGYSLGKKEVRKLKSEILQHSAERDEKPGEPESGVPILPDRNPEKCLFSTDESILSLRDKGNEAFKNGNPVEADRLYSLAIDKRDAMKKATTVASDGGAVYLWQLYSNRCAARIRLGKLDEAMADAFSSRICAPAKEIKPITRCAEALAALGMQQELVALLDDAATNEYNEAASQLTSKKQALRPKHTFRVGKEHDFKSITAALRVAPVGSEIIVDPGIYRETIFITRPVTIRSALVDKDFAAIRALEGDDTTRWATIEVEDFFPTTCEVQSQEYRPTHFIGLRFVCKGKPLNSLHAAFIRSGIVVFRNCSMTSSSGPVVAAINPQTRVVMQSCAVYNGAQGGILAQDSAHLHLQQVHCCHHAANGLELRGGATCSVEASHFYNNGRQGIMVWKHAGRFNAKDSFIHSNRTESGVLVGEAEASLESCWIYGNGMAGAVAQQKGSLLLYKCEVHDNTEGVLIQDTGTAQVEKCKVHSNRSNGIFVGFDHVGSAAIIGNNVYNNRCKGILIGNAGRVVKRGNVEERNHGLPPILPQCAAAFSKQNHLNPKYLKRLKKNEATIKQAVEEDKPSSKFDHILKRVHAGDVMLKGVHKMLYSCRFCKESAKGNQSFSKCSRCKSVSYCSKKCQKLHWPQHKSDCADLSNAVKYPTFIDPNMSVENSGGFGMNL